MLNTRGGDAASSPVAWATFAANRIAAGQVSGNKSACSCPAPVDQKKTNTAYGRSSTRF